MKIGGGKWDKFRNRGYMYFFPLNLRKNPDRNYEGEKKNKQEIMEMREYRSEHWSEGRERRKIPVSPVIKAIGVLFLMLMFWIMYMLIIRK